MASTAERVAKLTKAISSKCPPCTDGPCLIQPCGYHCKYPYTDDSTLWKGKCPACQERREGITNLMFLGGEYLAALTLAVETGMGTKEALDDLDAAMDVLGVD